MKSIFTFLSIIVLVLLTRVSYAQPGSACDCTPTTSTNTYIFPHPTDPLHCWIEITYIMVQCGPDVGITFSMARFIGGSGCYNSSNYKSEYKAAQAQILIDLGLGSNMSWVYPSSCMSLVTSSFPGDTCYNFVPEGPDSGEISGRASLDPFLELLPCDGELCCKLDYTYDVGTGRYKFVSLTSTDSTCSMAPPTYTIRSMTCLDINGNLVTHYGNVTNIDTCRSQCLAASNTLFKTSRTTGYINLPNPTKFNLSPIPAKDYFQLGNAQHVIKIELYDVKGSLMLKQTDDLDKQINIAKLKQGVYFVKIYFDENSLRSVKIIKE